MNTGINTVRSVFPSANSERRVKRIRHEIEQDYIEIIIPHRLGMVDIMHFALTKLTFETGPKPIELLVDGKLTVTGLSTVFSNPAIEAGIINARSLLEFLGLKIDGQDSTKLKQRHDRSKNDDIFIEDFTSHSKPLEKITVDDVKSYYEGPNDVAEKSLARIIHIGHKDIAHPTLGRPNSEDDYAMLEIAARGIRALTISFFFTKLGIAPPNSPVIEESLTRPLN